MPGKRVTGPHCRKACQPFPSSAIWLLSWASRPHTRARECCTTRPSKAGSAHLLILRVVLERLQHRWLLLLNIHRLHVRQESGHSHVLQRGASLAMSRQSFLRLGLSRSEFHPCELWVATVGFTLHTGARHGRQHGWWLFVDNIDHLSASHRVKREQGLVQGCMP